MLGTDNDETIPMLTNNDALDFSQINLDSTNFVKVNKELAVTNWQDVFSVPFEEIPFKLNKTVFTALMKYSNLVKTTSFPKEKIGILKLEV